MLEFFTTAVNIERYGNVLCQSVCLPICLFPCNYRLLSLHSDMYSSFEW